MAMPKGRTGNPAGRTPGTKNKKTQLTDAELIDLIRSKKTPLAFLIDQQNNTRNNLALRIECAKAAAPYVHKKQATAVEHSGGVEHHHRGGVMLVPMTGSTEDWAQRAAAAQAALKDEVRK